MSWSESSSTLQANYDDVNPFMDQELCVDQKPCESRQFPPSSSLPDSSWRGLEKNVVGQILSSYLPSMCDRDMHDLLNHHPRVSIL
ncbi:hypothetical protein BDP81DRAFT_436062 [Colletotrichum phormii]|uniref:Uncharacterized protein n=1 Tax=Colletotrichum phormii TaxID=359342 RepID=A0AAI9ZI77_9PEZI|nr:uncharacterized protein BDP81DRAFT_436062 [Colletotrichum phormii]KAK1625054.1 hypothetical protein BDP81DRAFT_436062 [Colletotrichum phormii]